MEEQLLKDFFKEEATHWWHRAKRQLIRDFLPARYHRVLILGVGGGCLCRELKQSGFKVVGLDVSKVACDHVREEYGVETVQYNLEEGLPFEPESFDAIIIADVLEHIRSDRQLIKSMHRCLKPQGRLLLTVPAYQHMWSYWDERLMHVRRYNSGDLKRMFDAGEFIIKKISFFNALIYPAALIWRKIFSAHLKEISSDFQISQGGEIINRAMVGYYAAERFFIKFLSLPFGLSLFVCAEKPENG